MTPGDWIFTTTGALLALAGLTLLAWSLLADRLRTRRARREGTLRRCPRCWYDMTATEGLTCPECGRASRRERSLRRGRTRRVAAAAALLLTLLGLGTIAYPSTAGGAWKSLLPDSAVVFCIRFAPDGSWATTEMLDRLSRRTPHVASVELPDSRARWQWAVLTDAFARTLRRGADPGTEERIWTILAREAPISEQTIGRIINDVRAEDETTRSHAAQMLGWMIGVLDPETIGRIRDACLTSRGADRQGSVSLNLGIGLCDHALALHEDAADSARLRAAREMDLTPEAIVLGLAGGCSRAQYAIVAERLGLRRSSPGYIYSPGAMSDPDLDLFPREMLVDDDSRPDMLIRVTDTLEGALHDLVFLRRGDGWRFAGLIRCPGDASDLESVRSDSGSTWLVRQAGGTAGESALSSRELWYRVLPSGLSFVCEATIRDVQPGYLGRVWTAERVGVERRRGRDLVVYEATAEAGVWPGHTNPDPELWEAAPFQHSLGSWRERVEYPIDASLRDRVPGAIRPDRYAEWMFQLLDEHLVAQELPRFLDLARTLPPRELEELSHFVATLGETPEVLQLERAIEARADQP